MGETFAQQRDKIGKKKTYITVNSFPALRIYMKSHLISPQTVLILTTGSQPHYKKTFFHDLFDSQKSGQSILKYSRETEKHACIDLLFLSLSLSRKYKCLLSCVSGMSINCRVAKTEMKRIGQFTTLFPLRNRTLEQQLNKPSYKPS